MPTAIDWSKKPPPWSWIGPKFRAEVELICGRKSAPPVDKMPDLGGVQFSARLLRAKISRHELADQAKCARTVIDNLANGRRSLSSELWHRIDAALTAAEQQRAAKLREIA